MIATTTKYLKTMNIFLLLALEFQIISKEFSLSHPDVKYKTIPRFRWIPNLPTNYRAFERLHNDFMGIQGLVVLPLNIFISHYALYCNLVLIRDLRELDWFSVCGIAVWNIATLTIWGVLLHVGGAFHTLSKESLKSWKVCSGVGGSEHERKYLKKFRKGCRPLFIGTEGYFVMRRLSVLKFFRGVTRGTFRIMLVTH